MGHVEERKIWILTDGKAGDENQCLGVAERLGGSIELRHVAPEKPWLWAMPWGPIPPSDKPERSGSPLSPPFPDIAIASGRRAVPYLRHLKKASPDTLTVFLKDPRCSNTGADIIWVPFHDKRRGNNVLVSLTGPHRLSSTTLARARETGHQALHHLHTPRLALILGGDTAKHEFGKQASKRLARYLSMELPSEFSVMVTPSRRTPDHLLNAVSRSLKGRAHWIWDGEGDNPYFAMLALADAIIVTADSHSMLSDVLATHAPVYIFEPDAYPEKLKSTISQLVQQHFIDFLGAPLETGTRANIDSTELIADEIRQLLKAK